MLHRTKLNRGDGGTQSVRERRRRGVGLTGVSEEEVQEATHILDVTATQLQSTSNEPKQLTAGNNKQPCSSARGINSDSVPASRRSA
jgi:hypothetical protein